MVYPHCISRSELFSCNLEVWKCIPSNLQAQREIVVLCCQAQWAQPSTSVMTCLPLILLSLVIISVHSFASSRLTCCGSAKNCEQHWLCSLQLFYQSVSSDFVPILISSVLIELSICVLELLLVHPYRAYWQAWQFPIYGAALCRVVYQDAVKYEEAGWLSQYSIKPWNFEIELTFNLLGLSNFNIHSLVHKHQGRFLSIIAQREGRRSENLDSKIPYSQMFLPLVGTISSTFVSAFKRILENIQTHPLKSSTKHFV